MEIKRRTPRTDMFRDAINDKMATFHEQLAEELGVKVSVLDNALLDFSRISSRITFADGEVDFATAQPGDSTDQLIQKFTAYLDSQCIEVIEAAQAKVIEQDRPPHPLSAPEAPAGADKDFLAAVPTGKGKSGRESENR